MMAETGRPSLYTPELAETICEMVAQGDTVQVVAEAIGFDPRTIWRWLGRHDEFGQMFARAKERQADLLAEQLIEISDTCKGDDIVAVQHAKLRIDTRKWVMSKMRPRKYGDRLEMEHNVGAETLALAARLDAARKKG